MTSDSLSKAEFSGHGQLEQRNYECQTRKKSEIICEFFLISVDRHHPHFRGASEQ